MTYGLSRSLFCAAVLFAMLPPAANAAETIGETVGVTQAAAGTVSGTLALGSPVVLDESVSTGPQGSAELRFVDQTHLGIGPGSTVKLDDFVYRGNSKSDAITIKLGKGAFRFITGEAPKKAYKIVTPLAAIGVRGTVLDFQIDARQVTVKLLDGAADICPTGRKCVPLDVIGQSITITPDGKVKRSTGGLPFSIFCHVIDNRTSLVCIADAAPTKPQDFIRDPSRGGDKGDPKSPSGGNAGSKPGRGQTTF